MTNACLIVRLTGLRVVRLTGLQVVPLVGPEVGRLTGLPAARLTGLPAVRLTGLPTVRSTDLQAIHLAVPGAVLLVGLEVVYLSRMLSSTCLLYIYRKRYLTMYTNFCGGSSTGELVLFGSDQRDAFI